MKRKTILITVEQGFRVVNPGELEISVGGSQPDPLALSRKTAVKGTLSITGEKVIFDN